MKLTAVDLQGLADLAVVAATEAGRMIARSRPTYVDRKDDGGASLASQVVTDIDRHSESLILAHLAPTLERYELGLLTEERHDDGGRLRGDHFWCIDPLDGTLPFIEGSPGYAVSIALVARDGTPVIGVVHDPVEATTLHAVSGVGAFRHGRPWSMPSTDRGAVLSVFADRSFLVRHDGDALIESLNRVARGVGLGGIELHPPRGAVMNACGALANPPGCYLKFPVDRGGGSLWDYAATACLFHAVGAVATDLAGDPLDLNRADSTFLNHRGVLFATDEELADRLRGLTPTG